MFRLERPERLDPDDQLEIILRHEANRDFHNTGKFRLSVSHDPAASLTGDVLDHELREAFATPLESRSEQHMERLRAHVALSNHPELRAVDDQIEANSKAHARLERTRTRTMVSRSVKPRVTRILPRGDWLDESGDVVQPGVPHFLPQPDAPAGQRLTRLDLANWLLAEDHPLTARVMVNRLWYLFFGQGLSNVLNDLGSQGEWPRHPELLDWLAVEFRESGWDVKHMVRLLVTSRAYRLSSNPTKAQLGADPLNRHHARQARFRIQAEFVRDQALAVSGLLNRQVGGRSVKPYQPKGYWADSYKSVGNPHKYVQDHGADLHRRGMYTFWKRTFLHPSLMAFDAPSRESCETRRPISNTPLQALVLLNDPTYVEAARALAVRALVEVEGSSLDRVTWLMRQVLGRVPAPAEVDALNALYGSQWARYQQREEDAMRLAGIGEFRAPPSLDLRELAAWTAVTRALLNLHETVTRS